MFPFRAQGCGCGDVGQRQRIRCLADLETTFVSRVATEDDDGTNGRRGRVDVELVVEMRLMVAKDGCVSAKTVAFQSPSLSRHPNRPRSATTVLRYYGLKVVRAMRFEQDQF